MDKKMTHASPRAATAAPRVAPTEHDAVSGDVRLKLGEAGLAVVPRAPTARMLEAGRLAGTGDPALARAIFTAMMEAAD